MGRLGYFACVTVAGVCGFASGVETGSWLVGTAVSFVIGFLAATGGIMWERIWR